MIENYNLLNTIFVFNYNRPKIDTIDTLWKIGYDGAIVIIMEDTDTHVDQVKKKYSGAAVIVINKAEHFIQDDMMDNLTGMQQVITNWNMSRKIAEGMGLKRYWIFDDDYTSFYKVNSDNKTKAIHNGETLKKQMAAISNFGYATDAANVGFVQAIAAFEKYLTIPKVFNTHNVPTDEKLFVRFTGRMNGDIIQGMQCNMIGRICLSFCNTRFAMKTAEGQPGGLTETYQAHGQWTKSFYAILQNPGITKIVYKFGKLGRYYHDVRMSKIRPKIIPAKYKLTE